MDGERWRSLFNDYSNSSFLEVLRRESPHLIPGHETPQAVSLPEPSPRHDGPFGALP